jgi:hypothetical protein
MNHQPILSIVTPTRGNFSDYWLENLLNVQGDIQFVIVYPPGACIRQFSDQRVKAIMSPYKGEMMQRFVALLNAEGKYLLALDDDDFVHPEILTLIKDYFDCYPDSIVLRPKTERIDIKNTVSIQRPWEPILSIKDLLETGQKLKEVPIAPLDTSFDKRYLVWPFLQRRDDKAPHIENFNNKIWQGEYVRKSLPSLSKATQLWGVLTWIPNSGFDRLMGLFVQAYSFRSGQVLGHWMPTPAQIRFISEDPALKPPRYHFLSDFILVKRFPQYGYFWNLFFNKISYLPRLLGKSLIWKVKKLTYRDASS